MTSKLADTSALLAAQNRSIDARRGNARRPAALAASPSDGQDFARLLADQQIQSPATTGRNTRSDPPGAAAHETKSTRRGETLNPAAAALLPGTMLPVNQTPLRAGQNAAPLPTSQSPGASLQRQQGEEDFAKAGHAPVVAPVLHDTATRIETQRGEPSPARPTQSQNPDRTRQGQHGEDSPAKAGRDPVAAPVSRSGARIEMPPGDLSSSQSSDDAAGVTRRAGLPAPKKSTGNTISPAPVKSITEVVQTVISKIANGGTNTVAGGTLPVAPIMGGTVRQAQADPSSVAKATSTAHKLNGKAPPEEPVATPFGVAVAERDAGSAESAPPQPAAVATALTVQGPGLDVAAETQSPVARRDGRQSNADQDHVPALTGTDANVPVTAHAVALVAGAGSAPVPSCVQQVAKAILAQPQMTVPEQPASAVARDLVVVLKPEGAGDVRVKLRLSQDKLSITIAAPGAAAHDILQRDRAVLGQMVAHLAPAATQPEISIVQGLPAASDIGLHGQGAGSGATGGEAQSQPDSSKADPRLETPHGSTSDDTVATPARSTRNPAGIYL